jgi:hypothetical protein
LFRSKPELGIAGFSLHALGRPALEEKEFLVVQEVRQRKLSGGRSKLVPNCLTGAIRARSGASVFVG